MPAAARLLERLGFDHVAIARSRDAELRFGVIWGGDELRWRDDGGFGLRVARGAFDHALREHVCAKGAVVLDAHTVIGTLPRDGEGEVTLRAPDGAMRCIHARRIAVTAGRRAAAALVDLAVTEQAPELAVLGLVGAVAPGFADVDLVEAVEDGWLWWMPLADGRASTAVFVDAEDLARQGTRTLLARALGSARGPAATHRGLRVDRASRATVRLRTTRSRLVLAGDAASAIDPLSSQGVEKALASGEHAAIAVHTGLARPELWDLCIAHHAQWERGLWRAHRDVAMGFYRQETRFAAAPFWSRRMDHTPARMTTLPARLRSRDGLVQTPALRRVGDSFVPEDGIVSPGTEDVLARIGAVPVLPLLRAFDSPLGLEEGVDRAGRDPRLFVLPRIAVYQAALQLFRVGALVRVPDSAAPPTATPGSP